MELWIRSQDKNTLCKVSNIFIDDEYRPNDLYRIMDNNLELGRYATKERALEVLDEIQHRLITLCDSMNRKLYIYEMPKE